MNLTSARNLRLLFPVRTLRVRASALVSQAAEC